jgi:U-box domain
MISIASDEKITTGFCSMAEIARALNVDVPSEFICPITMDVMQRPLMTLSGFNFEYDAILKWINTTSDTCPLTRQVLRPSDLIPNYALKDRIALWMREYCLPSFPTIDDSKNDDNDDDDVENDVIIVGYIQVPERIKRCFREKLSFLRSVRTVTTGQ